jgi:UDP-N-acetylglucosamine:LPS N-acetylglucosamine transferase
MLDAQQTAPAPQYTPPPATCPPASRPRQTRPGGVLILTTATGGGHDSVAVALQEALHELAPEVGVRILDPFAGQAGNGPFSPGRWYDATVAHAPWLWGLFYHATNNRQAVWLGMAAGALLWARRLSAVIETERPAFVVAVHPLCARLAADVLRSIPTPPPLHCAVTDPITIHRCWACTAVDMFYVATSEARDALVALGVSHDRLALTGLPVRAAFTRAPCPPPDGTLPHVLLLGGGHPSRRLETIAHALADSRLPMRLVIVCGRNTRLRRRLTEALGARASVLGWRDDIAALVRWSSVVIARGGPTTLVEALSQARPVLIYQVLPGQEAGNVALVTRASAGGYLPDVDALVRAVTAHATAGFTGNAAHAGWWGGSAQRIATRLLAAHTETPAALTGRPGGLVNAGVAQE